MSKRSRRRRSLTRGLHAAGQLRLVLLLAATTVILALVPALALRPTLRDVFSDTLAGDHVLRSHPSFAPLDVLEFFHEKRDALASAAGAALGAAVLGILLQILYVGGLVETLVKERRILMPEFFAGASRNFWHNIKCFAIFIVAAGITLGIWLGGAAAASRKLFEQTPPGATASLIYRIATIIIALLLFACLSLAHDFARIARRYEPGIGARRGYGFARRMLSGSWLAALGLFFFWLLAGGAAWLALIAVEWGTPAVSALAILAHTLLQLAAVFVRSALRVAAWGSYVALADAGAALRPSEISGVSTPVPFLTEPLAPADVLAETPLL